MGILFTNKAGDEDETLSPEDDTRKKQQQLDDQIRHIEESLGLDEYGEKVRVPLYKQQDQTRQGIQRIL